MEKLKHWTAANVDDLAFRVGFDFVAQLETKLEAEGLDKSDFAQKVGVSPGRVSQFFNSPSNLRVKSMVQYAHAVGMKVALVAYEDGDPNKGPISPEVFTACWRRLGRPSTMFDLSKPQQDMKQDPQFYPLHQTRISVLAFYRHQAVTWFAVEQGAAINVPVPQQQSDRIEQQKVGQDANA
jgi:transcriptional regulator with XRE-family HTH domain